jgi:hypothetical protein
VKVNLKYVTLKVEAALPALRKHVFVSPSSIYIYINVFVTFRIYETADDSHKKKIPCDKLMNIKMETFYGR